MNTVERAIKINETSVVMRVIMMRVIVMRMRRMRVIKMRVFMIRMRRMRVSTRMCLGVDTLILLKVLWTQFVLDTFPLYLNDQFTSSDWTSQIITSSQSSTSSNRRSGPFPSPSSNVQTIRIRTFRFDEDLKSSYQSCWFGSSRSTSIEWQRRCKRGRRRCTKRSWKCRGWWC